MSNNKLIDLLNEGKFTLLSFEEFHQYEYLQVSLENDCKETIELRFDKTIYSSIEIEACKKDRGEIIGVSTKKVFIPTLTEANVNIDMLLINITISGFKEFIVLCKSFNIEEDNYV